jgi:hypothetical protein
MARPPALDRDTLTGIKASGKSLAC